MDRLLAGNTESLLSARDALSSLRKRLDRHFQVKLGIIFLENSLEKGDQGRIQGLLPLVRTQMMELVKATGFTMRVIRLKMDMFELAS